MRPVEVAPIGRDTEAFLHPLGALPERDAILDPALIHEQAESHGEPEQADRDQKRLVVALLAAQQNEHVGTRGQWQQRGLARKSAITLWLLQTS